MAKTRVLSLTELPPNTLTLVSVKGEEIVLYRKGDEVFAFGNVCPHEGGSLSEGWVEGEIAVCPLHGWEFDVRSAACMTVPGESAGHYVVSVEDGEVFVEERE
jgi:nitrite reductase/ring-hydroxylating ferredoxin subunit